MPGGRPTKYRPEMCEELGKWMADGNGPRTVAAKLKISHTKFYEWSKDGSQHPEFVDAVKAGRHLYEAWWETFAKEAAQGTRDCVPAVLIFNLKNRLGWRDKSEVSGELTHHIKRIVLEGGSEQSEKG